MCPFYGSSYKSIYILSLPKRETWPIEQAIVSVCGKIAAIAKVSIYRVHLLRWLGWSTYFLSGSRSTGGGQRCPPWTTGLITGLIIVLITALPTCTTPVLIIGLTSGPACLPSNLDYSRNVELADRPGRFHPDGIPEITGISEADTGGFVRGQFGCVAGCHQPTEIIPA